MAEDDDYGRRWDYRVFSTLDTEPGSSNEGHRQLAIHAVIYTGRPVNYPGRDDISYIDHEQPTPEGATVEELQLDLSRMLQATDKPALIMAEWLGYLDRPGDESDEDLARRTRWMTGERS
jgi:hypothetical protein